MAKMFYTLIAIFTFTQISFSSQAKAYEKEFTVFDTRKTLPLHDHDPVYRDYYVNIGSDSGVKIGSILAVYRHVPVVDIYRNKAEGDLVVPIGHVKVIQTQKTMSVCRVASVASAKQIPVVDYETIMMGDQVQLTDDMEVPGEVRAMPAVHKKHKAHRQISSIPNNIPTKLPAKVEKAVSQGEGNQMTVQPL